jgi:hypothetical protein
MTAVNAQPESPSRSGEPSSFADDARADAPLGTLLFRAGLVPEDDLREALEYAKENKRRLGEVLLERDLVGECDLTRILASQKGLEYVEVTKLDPDPEAACLLSEENALEWGVLVIAFEEARPVVAVADASNRHVFGRVTEALGTKPRFVAAVPSDLARATVAVYEKLRVLDVGAAPALPTASPVDTRTAVAASQVVVLLVNGERVPVSLPSSRPEALEEAQELARAIDERPPGGWPLADGRFLRPEAIISVDVVDL